MGVKLITPFEQRDISQNTSDYSVVYSMRDLFYGITDQEITYMTVASSSTDSNSITVTAEGSLDGANWDTGVAILTTEDIGDGAVDFGSFNIGKPYAFLQFKATEDNNGDVVDFSLFIAYPTSEVVR